MAHDYHISVDGYEFYYTQTEDGLVVHEDCNDWGIIKGKTIDDFRPCATCGVKDCPFVGNLCYVSCVDNDALVEATYKCAE